MQAHTQPLAHKGFAVQEAVLVLRLWSNMMVNSNANGSKLVQHVAWLAPPLLQLLHAVLQVQEAYSMEYLGVLRRNAVTTSWLAFKLSAHPTLYQAVTGQPGDVALGATAAAALHQVRWFDDPDELKHCVFLCCEEGLGHVMLVASGHLPSSTA
jgi:hypothetical protein